MKIVGRLIVLSLAGLMFACSDVRAQAPSIACNSARGAGASVSEPVVYTNLESIEITLRISGNRALLDEPILKSDQGSMGNVIIDAVRLDGARRQSVQLRLQAIGSTDTDFLRGLTVSLGISVDPQRRTAAVNEYIQRIEASATDSPRDQKMLRELRQGRDATAKAFEQLYSEHQVGLFELRCSYSSATQGKWNGTQTSSPLYLRITDAGKFFDQPQFK